MASPGFIYIYEDVRLSRPGRLCYLVYSLSKLNAAENLDARAANSCEGAKEGVNDRDINLRHRNIRSLAVQVLCGKHTCADSLIHVCINK
jgi:hypothetical protein